MWEALFSLHLLRSRVERIGEGSDRLLFPVPGSLSFKRYHTLQRNSHRLALAHRLIDDRSAELVRMYAPAQPRARLQDASCSSVVPAADPTRSRGMRRRSDPCVRKTLPDVWLEATPMPSAVMTAEVSALTPNSCAAYFTTAPNGAFSGTLMLYVVGNGRN